MAFIRSKHHIIIYQSRFHLAVTILFVAIPFVFLLLFSSLTHIAAGKLFADVFVWSWRILIAYFAAAVLGWTLAVIFSRGKMAIIGLPLFDVLQSFPTFAALPMAVYFWGPSNLTVIVFLIFTIIWPIFFSIVSSLKLIRQDWQEVTEIFGLTGIVYLKKFLLPISLPGFITGSIVGLGEGWEALIVTELVVGMPSGLGSFFKTYAHNPAITALGIFGFLLLIFSLNKLVWLNLLDWSHKKMRE